MKRASFKKATGMDFHTGLAEIEAHEASLDYKPPVSHYDSYAITITQ